jgi:hypothetical protein
MAESWHLSCIASAFVLIDIDIRTDRPVDLPSENPHYQAV